MTHFRKSVMIGLAALSLAGSAFAQAPGRHGAAMASADMHAKQAERFSARMAKLHDLLKLTPAQEPAWKTYLAAITPQAATHPDHDAVAKMTAPERLEKMLEMAKSHTTMMESHLAALKTFYATLTAEQKKVFDDHVMGGTFGPGHMMRMQH